MNSPEPNQLLATDLRRWYYAGLGSAAEQLRAAQVFITVHGREPEDGEAAEFIDECVTPYLDGSLIELSDENQTSEFLATAETLLRKWGQS